jgi:hypothetical protein
MIKKLLIGILVITNIAMGYLWLNVIKINQIKSEKIIELSKPADKIYVDKIEYKDRIVYKDKIIYKLTEQQEIDLENYKIIDSEICKLAPIQNFDVSAHNGNTHNLQTNEIRFLKTYSKDINNLFSEFGGLK